VPFSCVLLAAIFLLRSSSSSLYRFQLLFETKTVVTQLEEAPLTVGKSFGGDKEGDTEREILCRCVVRRTGHSKGIELENG